MTVVFLLLALDLTGAAIGFRVRFVAHLVETRSMLWKAVALTHA